MVAKEKRLIPDNSDFDNIIDWETSKLMEDIFNDPENETGFNFKVLDQMSKVVEGFNEKQAHSIALLWVKMKKPSTFEQLPSKVQSLAWEIKSSIKLRAIWSELI